MDVMQEFYNGIMGFEVKRDFKRGNTFAHPWASALKKNAQEEIWMEYVTK